MASAAVRGAVLAAAWWAISEGRAESWAFGVPAVLVGTFVSLVLTPPSRARRPRLLPLLRLAGLFAVQSLRAGVVVALYTVRPRPALAPTFERLRLNVADPVGRVLLADLASLLPGTLTVSLRDDELLLHVLDGRRPVMQDVRRLERAVGAALDAGAPPTQHPGASLP